MALIKSGLAVAAVVTSGPAAAPAVASALEADLELINVLSEASGADAELLSGIGKAAKEAADFYAQSKKKEKKQNKT